MAVTRGLVLEYEFADPNASVEAFWLMALRKGSDRLPGILGSGDALELCAAFAFSQSAVAGDR